MLGKHLVIFQQPGKEKRKKTSYLYTDEEGAELSKGSVSLVKHPQDIEAPAARWRRDLF